MFSLSLLILSRFIVWFIFSLFSPSPFLRLLPFFNLHFAVLIALFIFIFFAYIGWLFFWYFFLLFFHISWGDLFFLLFLLNRLRFFNYLFSLLPLQRYKSCFILSIIFLLILPLLILFSPLLLISPIPAHIACALDQVQLFLLTVETSIGWIGFFLFIILKHGSFLIIYQIIVLVFILDCDSRPDLTMELFIVVLFPLALWYYFLKNFEVIIWLRLLSTWSLFSYYFILLVSLFHIRLGDIIITIFIGNMPSLSKPIMILDLSSPSIHPNNFLIDCQFEIHQILKIDLMSSIIHFIDI